MDSIRFAAPDIGNAEAERIRQVIDSLWITNGPLVKEFERRIAGMSGSDRAVACDSCTGAMELALRALCIGPGDEVITTPYTYTATAEVIRNVGAKIVFVDLDGKDNSFEMDYELLTAAINEKTKAVMPVDIGGKLCNYKSLMAAVLSRADVFHAANEIQEAIGRVAVVADAAHSFGAQNDYGKSGQLADFTCFSFHVLKNITTGGEGGAVVWRDIPGLDNAALERKIRLLGDHGQTSRDKSVGWEYDIELFGFNSIMTDVDAAMGLAQLDRYSDIMNARLEVTRRYDEMFCGQLLAAPIIKHVRSNYLSAMHLYPVRLYSLKTAGEIDPAGRDAVFKAMLNAGIPCNVHYKPLPMMTAYKNAGFDISDYPRAYEMFKSLISLPYHTKLTYDQQEYIVDTLIKVVNAV